MASYSAADVERIRQDLLYRLQWDVFGTLSDIRVVEQAGNANTSTTPFLVHSIASESLADPPLTKISVHIGGCEEKAANDEHEEEWRYQPPSPIVIEHEDNTPITLKEFVTRTHEFLNANKEIIFKVEDELYVEPEDLGDGMMVIGVGTDNEGGDGEYFFRGGNIPNGARFFFAEANLNEEDTDDYHINVDLFVEGGVDGSLEQFLARRDRMQVVHAEVFQRHRQKQSDSDT
jgi:hypothetical protein